MSSNSTVFKVFKKAKRESAEKVFCQNDFPTRKSARHYCKNQLNRESQAFFWIVHPDGTEEEFYRG